MSYKLLVDFGLLILIWMTQLVVYPSFTYFEPDNLMRWHSSYTVAIAIIVKPLMLAQLGLHGYDLFQELSGIRMLLGVLIVLIWINTFLFAVPLHNQIGQGIDVIEAATKLVHINWYRTVLWSAVFGLGLYEHFKQGNS